MARRSKSERSEREAMLLKMLGRQIAAARNLVQMSQRELARRIGTSQNGISNIETGNVDPTYTTLLKIAEHYAPQFLFGVEESGGDAHLGVGRIFVIDIYHAFGDVSGEFANVAGGFLIAGGLGGCSPPQAVCAVCLFR